MYWSTKLPNLVIFADVCPAGRQYKLTKVNFGMVQHTMGQFHHVKFSLDLGKGGYRSPQTSRKFDENCDFCIFTRKEWQYVPIKVEFGMKEYTVGCLIVPMLGWGGMGVYGHPASFVAAGR